MGSGPWLIVILYLLIAIVVVICSACGVFDGTSPSVHRMFAGGAGIGDFLQYDFPTNPLIGGRTGKFGFLDLTNNSSGTGSYLAPLETIPTVNNAVITDSTNSFFNSDMVISSPSGRAVVSGLVCSTNKGGPTGNVSSLIVSYSAVNINFAQTFVQDQNTFYNFMQFKTHVGGWQWGWTQFKNPVLAPPTVLTQFLEQTVWPFVDYYQMWNGTGALGFTGAVVTPNTPNTLIVTNYTGSSQPYYTTNYAIDPHTGPAFLFTNTSSNLGLDLPDGFILYFRQSSVTPFNNTYRCLSYIKTNVVTTPTVPSTETGNISFGLTVVNVFPNQRLTDQIIIQTPTQVFTFPTILPISSSPWIGEGLTNNCPGMYYGQVLTNSATVQTTCVLMISFPWIAYGLIQTPYTASPQPPSNQPYLYLYGSGSATIASP